MRSAPEAHIMGDILNASALGLLGFVVCNDNQLTKVLRNFEYLNTVKKLGKVPEPLFKNVVALSTTEFDQLLAGA